MTHRILLAAAAFALAVAPSAKAASWRQITSTGGANIDQVALVRTSDGVLHVAWHRQTSPSTTDLLHTAIGADGKVGPTTPIQSGWAEIQNAALVAVPGGIRAFFGGIRTTNPGDPNVDMNTALSTDGGASWTLQAGSVVAPAAAAYAAPVSAAVRADGVPVLTWAGSSGTWTHAGLDPAVPNFNLQPPLGDFGYDPGIAGSTVAWYSNATGHLGVFAQSLGPDGSPVGSAVNMPGTSRMSVGMLARTPVFARPGGGVYVAYPTGYPTMSSVRLWKVGASKALQLDKTAQDTLTALSGDASGRLWVAWKDGRHVLASRSNKSVSRWGAVVDAGAPKDAATLYRLDADATSGALDLFGDYSVGDVASASTYYTRIEPGLTLRASRTSAGVALTVTDAGAPVKGAKVRSGGRSDTTDSKGRATLAVKRGTVKATASGYVGASVKLK